MDEKVYFKNSKGIDLCGILSNPTSCKSKALIILCHGFGTNKDGHTYLRLEDLLIQQGVSTFRFDFFGHGESGGDLGSITVSEAVDDILNAIEYIKRRGYHRIGLMGSSFGGISSIIAASKSDDLFVLALKSPVSDYVKAEERRLGKKGIQRWKERGYLELEDFDENVQLKYSFFEDLHNHRGYPAARKIGIPTLIVHGEEDDVVPVEQSKRTASIIHDCTLEIIEGANHRYSNPEHFDKMVQLISDFIIKLSLEP
ncbi:MAG: alpha/beta hydrolase family protein [Thermoproteota archaeon]